MLDRAKVVDENKTLLELFNSQLMGEAWKYVLPSRDDIVKAVTEILVK